MRRRRFNFEDGSFYDYGEYGIDDIIPIDIIRKNVEKETLKQVADSYVVGRNLNKLANILGKKIVRIFIRILTEHLLDSDRIILGYGRSMYIGPIPHNPKRTVAKRWKNNHLFHTGGKRYGIILEGTSYRPYFRMPFRNRKKLAEKIFEGNRYYG